MSHYGLKGLKVRVALAKKEGRDARCVNLRAAGAAQQMDQ